jgi:hypothetical protein
VPSRRHWQIVVLALAINWHNSGDLVTAAQSLGFGVLPIDVPLSAKRQFQLFCSEHFPGLSDILDCLAADQLWALLYSSLCASSLSIATNLMAKAPPFALVASVTVTSSLHSTIAP